MHADREHLILWYLSIRQFESGIGHTIATVRISRSFLWNAMNDLMYVMQLWFLGIWNGHFSHLPKLNYRCKIKYLHGNMEYATLGQNFFAWFCPLRMDFWAIISIASWALAKAIIAITWQDHQTNLQIACSIPSKFDFHIDNRKRQT